MTTTINITFKTATALNNAHLVAIRSPFGVVEDRLSRTLVIGSDDTEAASLIMWATRNMVGHQTFTVQ